ncbi:MAG: dienelactone hydrolase [Gammaproteobacteria bacterium]|nr:dienelactone hydrolase [Gammaproteobacteria bacterium]
MTSPAGKRTARALYRVCEIPDAVAPYDRATLKIFYPAAADDGEEMLNSGLVPADPSAAPYPVVLMMPGINVAPESYAWLARELALLGKVVVLYSMIAEEMPGYISLTPGLDLTAITPQTYATRPSSTAIAAIVAALRKENDAGVLAGLVDIENITLAGHSAGGSVAMYNANPEWFPEVRGVIAYAAHAAASTVLGFEENSVLPLCDELPLLLIGGTEDGVIASSAHRYGDAGEVQPDRLQQTFNESRQSERGDSFLIMIEGANHFSIAWPLDESSGRHFLDNDERGDNAELRELLLELFEAFINNHTNVQAYSQHPLVSRFRCR